MDDISLNPFLTDSEGEGYNTEVEDALEIIRNHYGADDIKLVISHPHLYLKDGLTDTDLLILENINGITHTIEGNPDEYGITLEVLELLDWPPFLDDVCELEVDEDGEAYYPDDV